MGALIEEVAIAAALEAAHRGLRFTIGAVADDVTIRADTHTLVSALSNLFEDECAGLSGGKIEDLFRMFEQRGGDRTGLGLGLAISRQGVEQTGGAIRVRDRPGKGCVFTVDLPRVG